MDSTNLDAAKCRKIADALKATTSYLLRLSNRMHQTGFPANDPVFVKVRTAFESLRDLAMELNQRSDPAKGPTANQLRHGGYRKDK